MTDIAIEVQGLEELQKENERMIEDLHGRPMLEGMRDATLIVQRDAVKNAPVDTGRLRASITSDVRLEGRRDVVGVVGSNVVYAPYMEFGTGVFAGGGRHFPPPSALGVWARRHGFANGYVVARAIWMAGGLRPRKYLERAFDDNYEKIVGLVGGAVGKVVRGG
jgi:HK97 gp10 family phage protein